jgi:lysophospholipase L1-like esterase
LDAPDAIEPDYITVAYGTNDWGRFSREVLTQNCRDFYQKLSALYPNAKIFAITPIWRSNEDRTTTPYGAPLEAVREMIAEQTADLANVTVIVGNGLIPNLMPFTTDGLHPNDAGGQVYAHNLYLALKPYL